MTPLEILSRQFRPLPLPTAHPKASAPKLCGVYLLVDTAEIVYVGSSVHIEQRVWSHILGHGVRATEGAKVFDRALWYPLPEKVFRYYEGAFIRYLRPRYNAGSPRNAEHDAEILDGFDLCPAVDDEPVDDKPVRRAVQHEDRPFIGWMIKERRDAQGMSQRELARAARCSGAAVSQWETGAHTPTLDSLERVASALGVSVSALTSSAVSS